MIEWSYIGAVVDESSSMVPYKSETVNGFRDLLDSVQDAGPVRVSLVQFDTRVTPIYSERYLAQVPPLSESYHPEEGGATALYDAVGLSIANHEKVLATREGRGKIVVIIMSDGEDNASRQFTLDTIKKLVRRKQAEGWVFFFIGTGNLGQRMGVQPDRVLALKDATSVRTSLKQIATSTRQLLLSPPVVRT